MAFWSIAAAMAIATAAAALTFIFKSCNPFRGEADRSLDIYRRQLTEINQDFSNKSIDIAEAGQLRLEVSKRMLRAARSEQSNSIQGGSPRLLSIAAASLIALALVPGSALMYWFVGAPGTSDLPQAARIQTSLTAYSARPHLIEYLRQSGILEDGLPINELAHALPNAGNPRSNAINVLRSQFRDAAAKGNLLQAAAILDRIVRLLGDEATVADRLDLAEILIQAAFGYISPEAEAELTEVLEADPNNPAALYYLGLLAVQIGRPDQAAEIWINLLTLTEQEDQVHALISAALPSVAAMAGIDPQILESRIALASRDADADRLLWSAPLDD